MPSRSTISSLALTSGAIFTAGVGYVFARSPKQKSSSRSSLSSTISSICTPEPKKSPPFSPSALKTSFQKFKLFRSKNRQKPSVISDSSVTDDDASSLYSDTASTYTMTSSAPNLPGTLSPNLEILASTNGFNPRNIEEMIEEEDEMEWRSNSDEEYEEPKKARASLPIPSIPKQKHRRGLSMPPLDSNNNVLLYHHQRPSECWDDEFPLEEDLVVPDSLKEAQLSLRLNISTIRDFIHQVERLKILRDQKLGLSAEVQSKMSRKSVHGLADSEFRRYSELEKKFGLDWEKADVIIDLSDVAQDKQPTVDGDKSMNVDIERASSERHMQVLKIMMEETDLISMDYDDDEDNCEFHRRFHYKKHKNYSDHGRNTKKQKLTNADSTNISGTLIKKKKKKKENFRIDVEMMPHLVEHLKRLQNRLSGHVNDLENLITLITLSGG